MKYRWIDKNVDLNRLEEAIKGFLEERRFKINCQKRPDSFSLVGIRRLPSGHFIRICLEMSGTPNDFSLELQAGEQIRSTLKFGSMLTLLGGGGLLLHDFRAIEFYQELEEKFWNYIEGKIS